MLNFIALTAALTISPLFTAPQQPAVRLSTPAATLFPLATEDLRFDPEMSLVQMVSEYARVTGQSASIGAEEMALLSGTKVSISPAISVSPARVQQVFERVLVDSGFVLAVVSDVQPRVFSVMSGRAGRYGPLRSGGRYVPREDLEIYRGHPAVLISTVAFLPNTDVRQLSNAMRSMITDVNTQKMLPGGTTNCLVITGLGEDTVELVEMLERIDASQESEAKANPEILSVFVLQHAVAGECVPLLAQLLGTAGEEGFVLPAGLRVVADERTNSLVVKGKAAAVESVGNAVTLLDREN